MNAHHDRRERLCAPVSGSKTLALRVVLGLLLAAVVVQIVSFQGEIRQAQASRGAFPGIISALRTAFEVTRPPPPPVFDPTIDGDLSVDFECVAWRQTTDCSPDAERDPRLDLPCDANVTKDMAGYCEFRLKTSPETVRRILPIHCDSLRQHVTLRCVDAPVYLAYGARAVEYDHDPTMTMSANQHELLATNGLAMRAPVSFDRGIVFAVYEPGLLSAYATIRSLRALGCTLPIELWFNPNETSAYHPIFQELLTFDSVFQRVISDPRATRFYAKLYGVFYSAFDTVLLLDTDNFAVQDPTYLFDTDAFTTTGAVFWPDYWRPNQTIFHIHAHNLQWPILGLPFVDMFEQESGQVLIDRRRHRPALNALMYYGFTLPRIPEELRLLWGDKDLFRLAWMKTNSSFHYISRPPGSAGRFNLRTRLFCGLSMVQHDPNGEIIFVHRNTMKLSPTPEAMQVQWTHIQQFRTDVSMELYDIQRSWDIFPDIPKCWGKPTRFARSHTLKPMVEYAFGDLEKHLLEYARDGLALVETWIRSNPDHNTRPPPPPPPEVDEEVFTPDAA